MVCSLRALPRRTTHAVLVLWFGAMVFLSATLLARHLVALPAPPPDAAFGAAMASLRRPGETTAAVHVLYAECRCSRRIADHLLVSERPKGVGEHVLLVGTDPELERALRARGYDVRIVAPDELAARYHIEAVPLLAVLDDDGHVRYAGGYTTRKQGPEMRDLEIISRARTKGAIEALPLFGCAVSEELRNRLDPAGVLR